MDKPMRHRYPINSHEIDLQHDIMVNSLNHKPKTKRNNILASNNSFKYKNSIDEDTHIGR